MHVRVCVLARRRVACMCMLVCVYFLFPYIAQIATIGPTTSEAVQTSGLTVTVCPSASQPASDYIVDAMMEVDSTNS